MTPRERLFALEQFGIKLGLENIRRILDALDHPEQRFPSVHVAGTNGKGSVTAMVERGLRSAGYRTGRYTSPHLNDIEERIAIDGQSIDSATFDSTAAEVLAAVDGLRNRGILESWPTFFEVTTAIAFATLARQGVTAAVVEVGLGGRFDATNTLSPMVTAITSIALDHERHLGSTLEAIAFEKAGILKPGTPVILDESVQNPADARRAVAGRLAQGVNVKLAKSGLRRGREIVDEFSKLPRRPILMIGCMAESKLGLAASAQWAMGLGVFDYADLDSDLLLKKIPGMTGYQRRGPWIALPKKPAPGLGVGWPA